MDGDLFRTGDMYCAVWCRSTTYKSYENVYAVNLGMDGDACVMRVHKVVGALANGESFAGFLMPSLNVAGALTVLSHAYNVRENETPRLPHWVIVEAGSADDAMTHDDVLDVKYDIENPHPKSFCGVYFASNGHGCVKVGQTAYPLDTRLAQIQAGSPYRLYVCATIATNDRKSVEKQIHKSLADRRLHGEWFSMTDQEAVAIAVQHGGRAAPVAGKKQRRFACC